MMTKPHSTGNETRKPCLENRFGVPPSGGTTPEPPEGGTPNVARRALGYILAALVLLFCFASPLMAAAPQRGKERLRELAVIPTIQLTADFGSSFYSSTNEIIDDAELAQDIAALQQELKRQPDVAERQLRLGLLLNRARQTAAAQACFDKAVELARKQTERSPRNGRLLAQLGETLLEAGKGDEAEHVCRKAVQVSSNEAKCWLSLGRTLDCLASTRLLGKQGSQTKSLASESLLPALLQRKPAPEALRASEDLLREAGPCLDRAARMATNDPDVFLQRAAHKYSTAFLDALARHYRGQEKIDSQELSRRFFAAAAVPDLERAAQLSPDNYLLIRSAAWFEWLAGNAPHIRDGTKSQSPSMDPSRSLRAAMARLEDLGRNPNPKTAAGALETLAVLKLMISSEPAQAEADLRRALALAPYRDRTWELLLGVCAQSASPAEVTRICELRLKAVDSAHNRLILAKALTKEGKWDEAGNEGLATLKLDPDNIPARLLLSAIGLRQSAEPKALNAAAANLYRAKELIQSLPAGDEKSARMREFALNAAILNALGDEPQEARKWLEALLKADPNDQAAKDILSAIE